MLTSGQRLLPLLFPLPSTPHPLSDMQLRSSYQLPTSPDGHYHCPVLSTAGLKGLPVFLFLHLLILLSCSSLFLLTASAYLPPILLSSSIYPSCVQKICWMNPCRVLNNRVSCWRSLTVFFCWLQKFVRPKRNFCLSWQEKR